MNYSDATIDQWTQAGHTGRKMSIIENNFFKIVPEKCTETVVVATCVKCEPLCHEIKGHRSSSSNFLSHLKRVHGDVALNEYKRFKSAGGSFLRRRPSANVPNIHGGGLRPARNISTDEIKIFDVPADSPDESEPLSRYRPRTSTPLQCMAGTATASTNDSMACYNIEEVQETPPEDRNYSAQYLTCRSPIELMPESQELEKYHDFSHKLHRDNEKLKMQDNFDSDLMKFFIHACVPFRIVEDPYFKKIFENLDISAKGLCLASCHVLQEKLKVVSHHMIESLKEKLATVDYVCTSADIWTGRGNGILCVGVYWLNPNTLQRESAAVAIRSFKSTETTRQISELMCQIKQEFSLNESNVRDSITDNRSDFSKAFESYGIENDAFITDPNETSDQDTASEYLEMDDDEIDEVSEIMFKDHGKCYSHALTLLATVSIPFEIANSADIISIHHKVMAKCSQLWQAAGNRNTAGIIQNILGHSLTRPDCANWNSLYKALSEILQIQNKSQILFLELELKSGLDELDFLYIKEHLECTKPLADALNIMQDEQYAYYGTVMTVLFALLPKLEALCKKDWTYCKPIAESLMQGVRNRFEEIFTLSSNDARNAAIAALAHPEFKNRWMVRLDGTTEYQIMNAFKEAVDAERKVLSPDIETKPHADTSQFFEFGEEEQKSSTFTADLQVLQYLSDPSRSIAMLDKYPEIKRVFIKFNTPLPSTAPVERLFNNAKMTEVAKSNKTFNKESEMQLLLMANSHFVFN